MKPTKKKERVVTYEHDIACLPKSFARHGNLVDIPHKKSIRQMLAINKLVEKIQLDSVRCSQTSSGRFGLHLMGGDDHFQFKVFQ